MWTTKNTKCTAVKKDGHRCKLTAKPGDIRCEHHAYEAMSFLRNPFLATGLYTQYFPKNHHPACDRTGQNDCDCPDKTTAQLLLESFNRALQASLEDTPEYKFEFRQRHELITTKVGMTYDSLTVDDMFLPPDSHWRQFRFQVWESKAKRLVWKKVFDNFRNNEHGKKALLKRLRQMKPIKVFYMTSKFLNPRSVGPDPTSKMGGKKFKKKNLMRHYNNNFLGQELYFDVDFKMDSFDDSAKMTKRVVEWLTRKFSITPEDLTIVFSGGKGFHVIWYGWDISQAEPHHQVTYKNILSGESGKVPSVYLQRLHRKIKTEYIEELKAEGILVDYEVTRDPRRIIRLPGTIHHKGRPCKIISYEELDDFIPPEKIW